MVYYRAKDRFTISKYLQPYIRKEEKKNQKRCFQLVYTCMDNSKESEKIDSSDDEMIFLEGNIHQYR